MTIQEAIDMMKYRINTAIKIAGKGEDGNALEDMEMAVQALEKQIPKSPLRIPTDDSCLYHELRCPCCDAYMSGLIEMHHCKCGQALDWT